MNSEIANQHFQIDQLTARNIHLNTKLTRPSAMKSRARDQLDTVGDCQLHCLLDLQIFLFYVSLSIHIQVANIQFKFTTEALLQ